MPATRTFRLVCFFFGGERVWYGVQRLDRTKWEASFNILIKNKWDLSFWPIQSLNPEPNSSSRKIHSGIIFFYCYICSQYVNCLDENNNLCHLELVILKLLCYCLVKIFGATTITSSSSVNLQEKIYDIRFSMQMNFFYQLGTQFLSLNIECINHS